MARIEVLRDEVALQRLPVCAGVEDQDPGYLSGIRRGDGVVVKGQARVYDGPGVDLPRREDHPRRSCLMKELSGAVHCLLGAHCVLAALLGCLVESSWSCVVVFLLLVLCCWFLFLCFSVCF